MALTALPIASALMTDGPSDSQKPEPADASGDAVTVQRRIDFPLVRDPGTPQVNGDLRLETLNLGADASTAAVCNSEALPAGRRLDGGEVFDDGGDPESGFGFSFGAIGAGLENLGNTCFLNSVLPCLTYAEPFAAYLRSGKHKTSCQIAGFCAMCAIQKHKTSCQIAGFCAMCAIQKHVMIALHSTGKIVTPYNLVKNLRYISDNFHYSRQGDAHEYMVNLLESMHGCCLPSGFPSESPSEHEYSLVHKIFGGRLRSQVKCMQCSYSSNKLDPFLDLSLEIVNIDSLWKALKQFTAIEQLDGGERHYQCQQCREKVRAVKQLTIHKAPYVLAIHLKRFDSYVPGQKIDSNVEFEPTLDFEPFVSASHVCRFIILIYLRLQYPNTCKYLILCLSSISLGRRFEIHPYGVLVHVGWSTESGHYHCYVRTSTGMWHSLDDNQVYQVSEQTVLEQKAYILFYVRDRGSIVNKSVDSVQNDNISTNDPGNELENAIKLLPRITVDDNCQKHLAKVLKLPSTNESSDLTIAILHNDDTISNEADLLEDQRPLEVLNQSKRIEKIVDHEHERCSTSTGCHGEELFKLEETRQVDELKTTACGFDEKCVPTQDGIVYHLAGLKSIKSSLNGIYFCHKQHFLSSTIAHKVRRRNKRKKQKGLHKNAAPGNVIMNDQGASTSEATKNIVLSKCSRPKRSYSSSNRNSTNRVRRNSYCKSVSLDASNGEILWVSCKHGRPDQSRRCTNYMRHHCSLIDKDLDDSSSLLQCTRGLGQTTVSRLDNAALPVNSRKSSHILVEWDKEHDQGKRKRVQKSTQISGAKAQEKLRSKKRRLQNRPQEQLRVKRWSKKNQQQKKWKKVKRWSKNQQ